MISYNKHTNLHKTNIDAKQEMKLKRMLTNLFLANVIILLKHVCASIHET